MLFTSDVFPQDCKHPFFLSSCSSNEGSQLDPLGRGNSAAESLCAGICGTMLSK